MTKHCIDLNAKNEEMIKNCMDLNEKNVELNEKNEELNKNFMDLNKKCEEFDNNYKELRTEYKKILNHYKEVKQIFKPLTEGVGGYVNEHQYKRITSKARTSSRFGPYNKFKFKYWKLSLNFKVLFLILFFANHFKIKIFQNRSHINVNNYENKL